MASQSWLRPKGSGGGVLEESSKSRSAGATVGAPTMVQRAETALARLDAVRDNPSARIMIVVILVAMAGVGWWTRRDPAVESVDHRIEMVSGVSIGGSGSTIEPDPSERSVDGQQPSPRSGPEAEVGSGPVVIHVAGAVVRPGVITLAQGDRVVDAIAAAGGVTPGADIHQLNLAAVLVDGYRINVPRIGEEVTVPGGGLDGTVTDDGVDSSSAPVNVNRASATELETLVGIGPALAQAIVKWREEHGAFNQPDDLLAVPGIGPAKLANMIDRVRV